MRTGSGWSSSRRPAELRRAGIRAPILSWLHDPNARFDDAIADRIDIGVSSLPQLDRVAASTGTAEVQFKIDTGLGRNGATLDECDALFAAAAEHERLGRIHVRGLFSHLANTSEADDTEQLTAFQNAVALARAAGLDPELTHLAATAAAIDRPTHGSISCASVSASTDSRRSRTAAPPTSVCGQRSS